MHDLNIISHTRAASSPDVRATSGAILPASEGFPSAPLRRSASHTAAATTSAASVADLDAPQNRPARNGANRLNAGGYRA